MRHPFVSFCILTAFCALVVGCGIPASTGDPEVPAAVRDGNMTLLWGPEIKVQALDMINSSTTFCHLTMYELSDPDILAALAKAEQRGVDVEVVLDATEPHSQSTGLPYLQARHVKVRLLHVSGGISHIKSLVTMNKEGMQALLGGMNFGQYSWENHDASVFFARPSAEFESLFEQDYAWAGNEPHTEVNFPLPLLYDNQIEPAILQAVSSATESIVVDAFAFTSKPLIQALEDAVARGVQVTVLLDPKQSYNRRAAQKLASAGVNVRFYLPYQSEYLHAKIMSVDHGKTLFIGSANFSYHGFSVNHEGDVELLGVPSFAKSVEDDANVQFARGTTAPASSWSSGN